jgi:hypothetical protein
MPWENDSTSLWRTRNLLFGLALLGACALPAAAQGLSKSFRVSPEASELEVVNKLGSITVTAGEAGVITVATRQPVGDAVKVKHKAKGEVEIEVSGSVPVDFFITVPPQSRLDFATRA